jgi:hypothetical protein
MDATAGEILVQGGDSIAAARWSSRLAKPTAKLQEMLQIAIKKTGAANKISLDQSEVSESTGKIPLTDRAGEPQRMEGAMGTDASLMQVML